MYRYLGIKTADMQNFYHQIVKTKLGQMQKQINQ